MDGFSLQDIPWAIIAPVLVIQLVLMVAALTACIRSPETNGPKWMWILIIIGVSIFGPVAFFIVGRRDN